MQLFLLDIYQIHIWCDPVNMVGLTVKRIEMTMENIDEEKKKQSSDESDRNKIGEKRLFEFFN